MPAGSEHSTAFAEADFILHHTKVKVNLTLSGLQITQEGHNCLCCHRKRIPSAGMPALLVLQTPLKLQLCYTC